MNKNAMDKLTLLLVVGIFLIAVFVGLTVVEHIHNMSYEMGIMAEKIGTLEELVPLRPIGK